MILNILNIEYKFKGARHWESKNMNNEMEIETLETNLKEAKRIGEWICFNCLNTIQKNLS